MLSVISLSTLNPTGHLSDRIVGTNDSGDCVTEPELIDESRIIAQGSSSQLSDSAVGGSECPIIQTSMRSAI